MLWLTFIACKNLAIDDGWRHQDLIQIKDGFTSVFLILDETPALIDAGYQKSGKRITQALEKHDLKPSDIEHVFITHGHGDHLAGFELYPNARFYALETERDLIKEESGLSIDQGLSDGEIVSLGQHNIQAFAVPGHTTGNAVYLTQSVLVFGDSAVGRKDLSIAPPPEYFSDNPEQTAQAIVDLASRIGTENLQVDWLAFSHSGSIEGVDALVNYKPE